MNTCFEKESPTRPCADQVEDRASRLENNTTSPLGEFDNITRCVLSPYIHGASSSVLEAILLGSA